MSDIASERNSNSKSNLIDVQHVGVTAKLQSPLKSLMLSYSSSTESENNQILYRGSHHSKTKYNKFFNDVVAASEPDTTLTENSKILYEMKSDSNLWRKRTKISKLTPAKIEFQLYKKPQKRLRKHKISRNTQQNKKHKKKLFESPTVEKPNDDAKSNSIFKRLKYSLSKIKHSKREQQPEIEKIFADLPEPNVENKNCQEIRIGIYPFEYGCAEYLKTHDCPPQIVSLMLAEKATLYATHFWAEFFGSLQIVVAFIVTFLLQSYRFVLFSLINILLVEFLHMTSDYLVKPLLAVLFNGFLQPPLIFCFNILSSIRDILKPIADTMDNFMKPVATVGRSIRLVHATYNKKNIEKNV